MCMIALGKLLITVFIRFPNLGYEEFIWDSHDINEGIYLYTISAMKDGKMIFTDTKKMIISKFVAE